MYVPTLTVELTCHSGKGFKVHLVDLITHESLESETFQPPDLIRSVEGNRTIFL